MFPTRRMRRLRANSLLRDMVRETHLRPEDFIYPLFVQEVSEEPEPIRSMPGQLRHTLSSLVDEVSDAAHAGVRAVILFGIPKHKDGEATQAWAEDGIVQRAVRAIKEAGVPVVVITDVCMCEYTSHGHCGIVVGHEVVNDPTLAYLAKIAVSQVDAGADMVAPSDMMDGRVDAIRRALDAAGHGSIPIMSYAAKYASGFYGPFRDAADSAPQFGDRNTYQMDPANYREALEEVRLDIQEGADIVMVKPALAYLDVIKGVRDMTDMPVAAYSVSGEYTMIEAAAAQGFLDRKRVVLESLTSIKRAGADMILTYHAKEVARWLSQEA